MKKLEKKILKEVYSFESKQTLLKIIFRLIAVISFTSGVILLLGVISESLNQQKTFSIFELFFEDLEIIRENIWDLVNIFMYEAPIYEILTVFIIIVILIILFIKFVINFTRIKNKLIWLVKFFLEE